VRIKASNLVGFYSGKKNAKRSNIDVLLDRFSAIKLYRNDFFLLERAVRSNEESARWTLQLNPHVGYEKKLGQSAFSVSTNATTRFNFTNYNEQNVKEFGLKDLVSEVDVSFRYYFLMNKQILEGTHANDFDGFYVFGGTQYLSSSDLADSTTSFFTGLGYQYNLSNNLLYDVYFGLGPSINEKELSSTSFKSSFSLSYLF